MSRPKAPHTEGPGQDSFLDIVANLVGILIILVIIIGVRAQDAMLEAAPRGEETSASTPPADVPSARAAAEAVESDILAIDAKIREQKFNIEYRRVERDRIQLLVQAAQDELAQRRTRMDTATQQQFDVRQALVTAQSELDEITLQVRSLNSSQAPVTVIDHLPTPMAKTVFGRELHLRLANGRITHVPWDRLIEKLRDEAPAKLWRLKDQAEMTETLGPVGGFFMKYTLARKQHAMQTKVGVAIQQGIELDHFVLLPVSEQLGEPLEESLREGSALQTVLAAHPAEFTTVTVWTYPDSFGDFRQLKRYLFQRGYLTASRPLPEGFPIGGSPQGRRSAAQ